MTFSYVRAFARAVSLAVLAAGAAGCATESSKSLKVEEPRAAVVPYHGVKSAIAIGKFDNRSSYLRGLFSDGVDRLGGQAKTILIGHLEESGRFEVLERDNLQEGAREAAYNGRQQHVKGAQYTVTGDVVEFGRKEIGDNELFGILGESKKQIAYSKVTLNVVDVVTSRVVYSASGAGEYALSNRELLGFGSQAAYDPTLNGKVLDLAIREAVDHLVDGLQRGAWTTGR